MNKINALILLLLAVPAIASTNPWSELASNDLARIKKLVMENHPGPLDKQNKWFNQWFDKGFIEAKELALNVDTYQGYYYSLKFFVNGFKDGHLHYWTNLTMNRANWPGFVIARRGDNYVVHNSSGSQRFKEIPPKGALLVSCDGKSVKLMMEKNIFPYAGNKDLAAHWIEQAPLLFVDFGNPFANRAKKCMFKNSPSSKPKSFDITWKPTKYNNIEPMIKKAGFGARPTEFAHRQFGNGKHWISVPTFGPSGKKADQLEKVISGLGNLRKSKIVVFDVRGNGGGNSQWGNDIVNNLYGENYKKYRESLRPSKSYVEWRSSAANLSYLQKVVPGLKERFGSDSSIYRVFNAVAEKMAQVKSKNLLRQPELDDAQDSKFSKKSPNPVEAKVFFLTDGHCGSACLDFADGLLNMANVTHIGLPTSADTVYMDIRREELPSSVGNLSFAMKVYRDRLRGNNQAYTPSITWDGDIWDTEKLEKWISKLAATDSI